MSEFGDKLIAIYRKNEVASETCFNVLEVMGELGLDVYPSVEATQGRVRFIGGKAEAAVVFLTILASEEEALSVCDRMKKNEVIKESKVVVCDYKNKDNYGVQVLMPEGYIKTRGAQKLFLDLLVLEEEEKKDRSR